MTYLKKISNLALLFLASNTALAEPVNFCKVKKIYDNDINVPTKTVYEDCSGVAFLWYAKDFVKASCWEGATDLLEGKCETHKQTFNDAPTENSGAAAPEAEAEKEE